MFEKRTLSLFKYKVLVKRVICGFWLMSNSILACVFEMCFDHQSDRKCRQVVTSA